MKNKRDTKQSREVVKEMAKTIKQTLSDFGVDVEVEEATEGFRFYHFHLKALKPVRMRAIKSYEDDLRYALGSDKVEIQAPIPNQKLIGVTVPKKDELPVLSWSDIVSSKDYKEANDLVVPLGMDEFGVSHFVDIARMPHLLIGGSTGSGKSVLLHSFISSLIQKHTPDRFRMLLIDPKRVELVQYQGLPHLLTDPIDEPKKALLAFRWAIKEMERRYDILVSSKVDSITEYHEKVNDTDETMPYILIVIDELADCMHTYPKEFESAIIRLAQMSRPTGIHMIISTQRPSSSVVTGMVKANLPTRIAFSVASNVDSRVILDVTGAEKLDGSGDMLFLQPDDPRPVRLQGYYLSEEEVLKNKKEILSSYGVSSDAFTLDLEQRDDSSLFFAGSDDEDDEMYEEAKKAVIEAGKASTSYLQRKLRIGYSRTARLMDLLEDRGVIGPADGASPRKVIDK